MPITSVNQPVDPTAITFVVTTFKQRDQWSRKIGRDPRVKLMHRHVLRSLALCARTDKDGRLVIDPTYDALAKAAACNSRTAMRAVAVAKQIGIVRKARDSDGRVSNAYQLLLPEAGSNRDKFSPAEVATDANVNFSTVTNSAVAAGSNHDTAAAVLRVESKEQEDRPVTTTNTESDHNHSLSESYVGATRARAAGTCSPEPLTPVPRAVARTETVETQNQTPSRDEKNIGRPENGANAAAAHADFEARCQRQFEDVLRVWPPERIGDVAEVHRAFSAAVTVRGVTRVGIEIQNQLASGDDVPDLADALAAIAGDQARRTMH